MTVEAAVYSILSSDSAVDTLVDGRVYPKRLPQSPTLPAVTYFRVGAQRSSVMGNDTGIVRKRIQVSSWGKTYAAVNELAEAVRNAMQRKRGTFAGVEIIDIFVDGDASEMFEDDVEIYQAPTDYEVIYRESV